MVKTIKAKYTNGTLKPMERLGLQEGQEVFVTINTNLDPTYEEWANQFKSEAERQKGLDGWEEVKKYLDDYRHPERRIRLGE